MTTMKLLIGYDGSPSAGEAIEDLRRAGLATSGVEAVVMSVADAYPVPPGPDYAKVYPQHSQRRSQQIDDAVSAARKLAEEGASRVRRLFPDWNISAEAVADSPYWGLVKRASEWRADLLVVGSHGRSAVGRLVFGSVSTNAILYADSSARVGRRRQGAIGTEADAPVRIIIGWDGSPHAQLAVRAVAARQWPSGSEVRVVTAVEPRLTTVPLPAAQPGAEAGPPAMFTDAVEYLHHSARAAVAELRSTRGAGAGLNIGDPILREGDPKRILLDDADVWQADCIFVGAKGMSRAERVLLGSVSSTIAARAPCSVETVRPARDQPA